MLTGRPTGAILWGLECELEAFVLVWCVLGVGERGHGLHFRKTLYVCVFSVPVSPFLLSSWGLCGSAGSTAASSCNRSAFSPRGGDCTWPGGVSPVKAVPGEGEISMLCNLTSRTDSQLLTVIVTLLLPVPRLGEGRGLPLL